MQDEMLVETILKSVVNSVNVPVTLKMRTGWNRANKNAPTIAKIAQDAGIQMLSVHGRTKEDKYTSSICLACSALLISPLAMTGMQT
jgi:tRNA-dihydrouridine synthase B